MRRFIVALLASLAASVSAQTYDPDSRVLSLPTVTVADTAYADVLVRLLDFEVLSIGAPVAGEFSFDPATQILALPTVAVAATTYSHVRVRLRQMQVISVGAATNARAPTRIYVNLVAHNEDTATGANADCKAFFSDADRLYDDNRAALETIAATARQRGATLNFQSDVEYLNLVLARESAQDNVLRRLASGFAGTIEIDAHAHESLTKNYADVANLVERVAGVRNGVVGGFTAAACRPGAAPPDWDRFRAPLRPASGPGPSFSASVLTLGASAGHVCDPDASGIWRPAATGDFFTDDPAQTLPTIGTGYAAQGLDAAVTAIGRLADDLKAGRLQANRMYTASVTIAHCNMHLGDRGSSAADVARFIDAVEALDDDSDFIRWATFTRMLEIWRTEYAGAPSVWRGRTPGQVAGTMPGPAPARQQRR